MYIGGLIAAGITFGTFSLNSTWAWRIPSLIQGTFSIITILLLPFIPESPRWLAFNGRVGSARTVLAQTYSNGVGADGEGAKNPVVELQLQEILDTLEWERKEGQQLTLKEVFRTPNARKRVTLACSAAVFSTIAGQYAHTIIIHILRRRF